MTRDPSDDNQLKEAAHLDGSRGRDRNKSVRGFPINSFDLIALLIIVAAATLVTLPLFFHGFAAGDDSIMHYRRAADFIEALREGAVYPRWLPRSNFGQGTPVMLYYPPLPYYVAAAFDVLVRNPLLSVKLGCWFALTLSGVTMYVFGRSMLLRPVGLLMALTYLAASYHLFDLYHRCALSEYWSFAWLPLVLDGACRVAAGRGWRAVAYLSVSYALLLLTHVTISFELTVLLPVFLLLLTRNIRRVGRAAGGLALGCAISAIFIVPLLLEISYIRIDRALRISYLNWFLFENLGGAFTAHVFPAPAQRRYYFLDGVNLMALGIALLFAISAVVIWRKRRLTQETPLRMPLARSAFAVTALSLLLTTRLSAPVWLAIPQFPYIQFPFRWLEIATVGAILLGGVAASILARAGASRGYVAALAVAFAANVAIGALVVGKASYDPPEALEENRSALEVAEYRTVWLDRHKHLDEFEKPTSVVISGDATVTANDETGARQSYAIDASTASTIKLRTLFFPGWVARVDGADTDITHSGEGAIQLTVDAGQHTLILSFEDTPPRIAGKIVSAAGLLALAVIFFGTSNVLGRKMSIGRKRPRD